MSVEPRPRGDCRNADGRPKQSFTTRQQAREFERVILRKHGDRLRAYPCPQGHGYHLGHAREMEPWE